MGRDGRLYFIAAPQETTQPYKHQLYRFDMASSAFVAIYDFGNTDPRMFSQRPGDGVFWVHVGTAFTRISETGTFLETVDYGGSMGNGSVWHDDRLYTIWRNAGNQSVLVSIDPVSKAMTQLLTHPAGVGEDGHWVSVTVAGGEMWMLGDWWQAPSGNGNRIWKCKLDGSGLTKVAQYDANTDLDFAAFGKMTYRGEDGYFYLLWKESGVWTTAPVPPGTTGRVKVWDGSAWLVKPVKVWDGSAWVTKPTKVQTGSGWA